MATKKKAVKKKVVKKTAVKKKAAKKVVKKKVVKAKAQPKKTEVPEPTPPPKPAVNLKRPLLPVGFIATALNLTDRRVQQLASEGIIPKAERGKYDLIPTVQAYVKYLQEQNLGQTGGSEKIKNYKEELQRLKVEGMQLDIDEKKKILVPVEGVKELLSRMVVMTKTKMQEIPARLSPVLLNKKTVAEVHTLLKTNIQRALNELKNDIGDT